VALKNKKIKKVFTLINNTLLLSLHAYKYFSDMNMQLDICKMFNGSGLHDKTEMILYKLLANMSPLFCKCVRKWREVLGRYSVYREYDIYMAYNHNTVDLPSSLPSTLINNTPLLSLHE
jgi:hypothetical protein